MGLNTLDLLIIAVYLAGITLFGLRFRKRQRSLRDYFLADRNIPWWAISLSIVAAETSTLTIISVPGLAYATNFTFLQLVFGYIVGRVLIAIVLLPHYFRGDLFTAYELIQRRFGPKLHSMTAGLFLITRAAAEGVRVFAVAIVVGIALSAVLGGFNDFGRDLAAITIVTALTLIYTFEGGLSAVIWTDVVQTATYVGGTLVGFFTILHSVPGGWSTVSSLAENSGKFRVFDFSWSFFTTYTFWSGVVGGSFLTLATHGTDQLIVQRLLAARGLRQSQAALIASGVFVAVLFTLFLMVGAMLFAFYHVFPPTISFGKTDRIFPTFIVTQMPHGISGVLIAAILAAAMSNLSAALNSLSSSSIVDFYTRFRPQTSEYSRVRLSRIATVFWGLILFAFAIISRHGGRVVEVGLSIAGVAFGALLGVFLLGVLTKRANERGTMVGMLVGFLTSLYIWEGRGVLQWLQSATSLHWTVLALPRAIPFTWWFMIGSCITFAVGYLASILIGVAAGERSNAAVSEQAHT
ncbi:MAG TPA: sodium:solute symporter [Terriglobales bacterium]|nr:sodium:solute symporter [Terriglobales bacterium]